MCLWNIPIVSLYITFWNGLIIDAACLTREVSQFHDQGDPFGIALKEKRINNSEEGYSLFLKLLGSASQGECFWTVKQFLSSIIYPIWNKCFDFLHWFTVTIHKAGLITSVTWNCSCEIIIQSSKGQFSKLIRHCSFAHAFYIVTHQHILAHQGIGSLFYPSSNSSLAQL